MSTALRTPSDHRARAPRRGTHPALSGVGVSPGRSIGVVATQAGMAVGAAIGGVITDVVGIGAVTLLGVVASALALLLLVGLPRTLRRAAREQMMPPATPISTAH